MQEKLVSLEKAAEIVGNGSSLAIGGITLGRKPMAFLRQLVKREVKDLSLYAFLSSIDVDMLIGAGCVKKVAAAYIGFEGMGMAPNFRRSSERDDIEVVELSEYMYILGLRATRMGLPYLPTKAGLGSQLVDVLGLKMVNCPYTNERFLAVPAIIPDIAVIHVLKSDIYGNVQNPAKRDFLVDSDYLLMRAAKKKIITAEEIVPPEEIREKPEDTIIFHYEVDAVVHAPKGAYPTSFVPLYPADLAHIGKYLKLSKDPKGFQQYLKEYVLAG
jgi:glutaconate CoA-transferase, subunit A